MSFTRFHDDPARIRAGLEISTYSGRYFLNTPGMGVNMPLQMDPQLRLQGWGANLCTNAINLESDFRGLTRKMTRDLPEQNEYKKHEASTDAYIYDTAAPIVDESRATHPAWMFREAEHVRWEHPFINPQDNFEQQFPWNIQTRVLEKDYYKPKVPQVLGVERSDIYFKQLR